MFKMINRYKKGVSPVIAVVLLIALTVAAAAVIWQITQDNLSETGTLVLKSDTTTAAADGATVSAVLTSSHDGLISGVTLDGVGYNNSAVTGIKDLDKGDNSKLFTFADTGFLAGETYDLVVTWSIEGETSNIVSTLKVTAA
jgi:flagellin-like protein